jgi:FAD/FMN-containing dehydrogenase
LSLPDGFRERLGEGLPPDTVSDDPDELATYGRDWTRVYEANAALVARPRSTQEVATILARCDAAAVPVVPSGGRTGLAGGAVAKEGEVVLSLDRMRELGEVDTLGATLHVEAGAVTEAVHHHAEAHGLTWPVDFASKGSSTVGGNISTNAGGVKVIRFGLTRSWVLGLTVVTATGEILELGGALEKDNTGIDLRQLFIGSEGILGVITEATLKLAPVQKNLDVFLFAVPDLPSVLAVFREARQGPFTISAYEFFTDPCLERLSRHRKVPMPFRSEASHYVLLEVEGADDDALTDWLEGLLERDLVMDGTLAQNRDQAKTLWELREGISESLSATGLPHKNDIALPIAGLEAFVSDFEELMAERYPTWEICLFGHIGDGNLHVNVMKPDDLDKDAFIAKTHEVDRHLFELVERHHGSISAEHGIGLLKKEWLGYTRSPEEVALMRALKRVLDPKGILNPGKVL